ncbi:hypothetical protein D3C80_106140 [compost metagenome]
MRPKFAIGEIVLLRSTGHPELNNEYCVKGVEEGTYKLPSGEFYKGYAYWLDGLTDRWVEYVLRKKHIPGEMSFENLMQSLSSPKLLTHQPQ